MGRNCSLKMGRKEMYTEFWLGNRLDREDRRITLRWVLWKQAHRVGGTRNCIHKQTLILSIKIYSKVIFPIALYAIIILIRINKRNTVKRSFSCKCGDGPKSVYDYLRHDDIS